ncbi:MAG: serine hydrolase [Microbacteriaceae bacterium]|nr:serine hydrolase [Microbacteriaceae bacterium]
MVVGTRDPERGRRQRAPREGRHRGAAGTENFSSGFSALGQLAYAGANVSASVIDLRSGLTLVAIDDRVVLPTAGIGRILLLIEVSARISARDASGFGILEKTQGDSVAEAGIWRHLQAPALPVTDLAALVGATGDTLATNVLLRQVGLASVRARAESLGLSHTALLDLARTTRGPDDAPQLSVGSTSELARLFAALAHGETVDPVTSRRVLGWLAHNSDLSLVASAFGLDPLSHRSSDHGLRLINATGADRGVRSEVGMVSGTRGAVAYAVSVRFSDESLTERLRVLEAMRTFGHDLLDHVH